MAGKGGAVATPQRRAPIWGDPGVSEREVISDIQLSVTPNQQQIQLTDAGILDELEHHVFGTVTITPGTGTVTRDVYGPYDLVNFYQFSAGPATVLHSYSGRFQGILQTIEYPGRNWEANADPASIEDPLTNSSDFFNFPTATGVFRYWVRVPITMRWNGMPGGKVGYITLQNKKITNIVRPTFNVTGAASPFSLTGAAGGGAPYNFTGNGTATAPLTYETWKLLQTVPAGNSPQEVARKSPVAGFLRYILEDQRTLTGSAPIYNFEPGGELLRAIFQLFDATAARGVATANVQQMSYQYGTAKQVEIYTPQRNLLRQLDLYGRVLPQGCYAFDFYTQERSLLNTKNIENTANVQVQFNLTTGYTPPNGSMMFVLLDKLLIVQNYLSS
jgi:hypothetical protein